MVLVVEELVVQAEAVMLLVEAQAVILVLEEVEVVIITLTILATAAVIITTTITTGTTDVTEHQDVLFFYKLCLRSIILISICSKYCSSYANIEDLKITIQLNRNS